MNFKFAIKKLAELGVGLTTLSLLVIAGCGGGGGGSTASSGGGSSGGGSTGGGSTGGGSTGLTLTGEITPGKGVMRNATVNILNATQTTTIATGVTNASGVAAVSMPSTSTGPYVVQVICGTSCTYYDELSATFLSGSASASPMLAVVPNVGSTYNIGVTAATNAAAQYAIAVGPLTPLSVRTANATVVAALGLPTGTSLITAPTLISSPATYSAALTGTSVASILASYSAGLSMAASGVTALQAINALGTAWQTAATTNTLTMPSSINTAALISATSGVTVTQSTSIASAAASATAATSTAVAGVSALLAEAVAGNDASWWANNNSTASAVNTTDVMINEETVTASGNTYTWTTRGYKSTNLAAFVSSSLGDYALGSTGWRADTGGTVIDNADGTVTLTPNGIDLTYVDHVTRTDLSGTAIPCPSYNGATPPGGVCGVAGSYGNYPAGSYHTTSSYTVAADEFYLNIGGFYANTVTNTSGTQLTGLPTLSTTFCVQYQGPYGQVFAPITPTPAAGLDNYNMYFAWSCSAADIATALGAAAGGTALLSAKSTGNAVVPTVGLVKLSGATLAASPWLQNTIIGVYNGLLYPGNRSPAGTASTHINVFSKVAAQAEITAFGLNVTLP